MLLAQPLIVHIILSLKSDSPDIRGYIDSKNTVSIFKIIKFSNKFPRETYPIYSWSSCIIFANKSTSLQQNVGPGVARKS